MAKVKLSAEELQRQLVLEAVRSALDGQPRVLCGTGGLFAAKQKEAAETAVRDGYLEKCAPPQSLSKSKKASPEHVRITDKGRRLVLDATSPRVVLEQLLPLVRELTTRAGTVDAVVNPADGLSQTIREQLGQFPGDAFRVTMEAQLDKVRSALEAKVDQAIARLREELLDAVARIAPPPTSEPIAPLLRSVQQTVERALAAPLPSDPTPLPTTPAPTPERPSAPPAAPTSPPPLPELLKDAYEKLCLLVEYKHERLVDLPRLFHEARKALPELTASEYHAELLRLWRNREVMLHIINEVRRATEPDLGIRHDGALYYYVNWNSP